MKIKFIIMFFICSFVSNAALANCLPHKLRWDFYHVSCLQGSNLACAHATFWKRAYEGCIEHVQRQTAAAAAAAAEEARKIAAENARMHAIEVFGGQIARAAAAVIASKNYDQEIQSDIDKLMNEKINANLDLEDPEVIQSITTEIEKIKNYYTH